MTAPTDGPASPGRRHLTGRPPRAGPPVEIRPITEDELPAFVQTLFQSFGRQAGEEELEETRAVAELDRTLAIFDGSRVAASAAAISFQLTLPGRVTVPAAGVTAVGVLPTHHRRGMLTALMGRQLDDVADRGEHVAVLGASESIIYGRFGYGMATQAMSVAIERSHAALVGPVPGEARVRMVDRDEIPALLPEIYDRYRLGQPGEVDRPAGWWEAFFHDYERYRGGATARFAVVYDGVAGRPEGYVTYRLKGDPFAPLPDNTLVVEELVTTTAEARAALWRYCLSVDLVRVVSAPTVPMDDPLRWMLADPRRLEVTGVRDVLWLRLVDVAAALAARTYAVAGALVLEVDDRFRPSEAGRYRLEGGPDGAECRSTSEAADLALGVADLGALYLGGVRATVLARAGRVLEERPGSLARADAMLAGEPTPYCSTDF